ncbi:hypothetical protein TM2_24430 [Bacillus altitudinis]|nr:hypothetical protein TM2_24430 [Bacillus altitudinis]
MDKAKRAGFHNAYMTLSIQYKKQAGACREKKAALYKLRSVNEEKEWTASSEASHQLDEKMTPWPCL